MTSIHTQSITELFIDKLVLLVNLSKDDAQGLASILLDDSREHVDRLHGYYQNYRGIGYKYAFGLPLNNEGNTECKIFLVSFRSGKPQVRIEYNPSKLSETSHEHLWNKLAEWFPNEHYSYLQDANVSRIDIAIDITPVSLDTIWITAPRFRVSKLYNGSGGKLESITLGSNQSDSQIKLYNKEAEQQSRGIPITQSDTARIEYRVSRGIPINKLYELENVLTQISLIHAIDPHTLPLHENEYIYFLDSVRYRGLHAALGLINGARSRRNMRLKLEELSSFDWWEPEEMWQRYDSAINNLHIPDDITHR